MEIDLNDALQAWQGVSFPEERIERLLHRLENDQDFRKEFAAQVWALSLTKIAQAPDPRWLALYEEIGLETQRTEPFAMEESLMNEIRRQPVRFVQAWWRWAACGAVAAVLALSCSLWFTQKSGGAERSVATLVASRQAVWKSGNLSLGKSLPPSRIQLVSGGVSLSFRSGVLLHVQGPADLQLLDDQRVFCKEGQLRMRVPPGAEGFAIETPGGGVTDLGTELGVAVKPGQNTRVAVFEGKAEASLNIPGQGGVRTELLQAQQSAELRADSGEIRASSLKGFLDASEIPEPPLRLSGEYSQLIRTSQPALYWRVDRAIEELLPAEIPGTPALVMQGNVELQPDGGGRTSAFFKGGALYTANEWSLPGESYALECWFFSQPMAIGALAGITTGPRFRDHFAYIEFPGHSPGKIQQPGMTRYLSRWPAASGGGISIFAQPKSFSYRWHHLVAQQTGTHFELFIDGESVGSAQGPAPQPGTICAVQFGSLRWNFANTEEKIERPFTGRLAEIAVYTRGLTLEEIRQHARQQVE
ncbi:MAG: LamG-like jellyroll fold domain-containing protein [Verrucomicrobiota bacterium]